MNDSERARIMLSNMPDAVFDTWLLPIIEDRGWPFTTVTDALFGVWAGYFRCSTLKEFSDLLWYRETLTIDSCVLHPSSKRFIDLAVLYKSTDFWADIAPPFKKTKPSLAWHMSHIERTGKLCAPLVLTTTPRGFIVHDGSHRLAALLSMNRADVPIDAWIGTS